MNNGWKTVPLEALAVQQKGSIKIGPFGSQLRKRDLASSGIHVVGIENVLSGIFDGLGERYISPEKFETLRTVQVLPGDVLITMMGTIGKVAVVPDGIDTSIMDSHLLRVRPDRSLCNTKYLIWAIYGSPAVQEAIEAKAHGAIMQGLNSEIVRSLPILLPPLPAQKRIVGILDEVFDSIAIAKTNAEKNLKNARALFESHLQSVFTQGGPGWVEKRLGEIADFKNGLNFTRQSKGQTLCIVGVGDFQDRSVVPIETLQSVTIDGEIGDDYLIRRDDILTVRSNGSRDLVGRCMLVPDVDDMTSFSGFIIRLRFDTNEISPRFLLHFMKSSGTRDRLTRDGGGANISNINQAKLSELPISLPCFKQQEDIANRLDTLSEEAQRLVSVYERKLAAFEALKKSVLHQAFTGNI
jgi:type I restriction enzyme S subunit